jgi:hypothetical protein
VPSTQPHSWLHSSSSYDLSHSGDYDQEPTNKSVGWPASSPLAQSQCQRTGPRRVVTAPRLPVALHRHSAKSGLGSGP